MEDKKRKASAISGGIFLISLGVFAGDGLVVAGHYDRHRPL